MKERNHEDPWERISRAKNKKRAALKRRHLVVTSLVPVGFLVDELAYVEAHDGFVTILNQAISSASKW
jgi:hypothetical protein